MPERWDLFDEDRMPLHRTVKRGAPFLKGFFHIVVQCWIMTPDGRVLITKRSPARRLGGLFECTGGSVLAGESSRQGIVRELLEEIGLKVDETEPVLIGTKKQKNLFLDTYLIVKDINLDALTPQEDEVIDIKLVTLEQYDRLVSLGLMVNDCRNLRDQLKTK